MGWISASGKQTSCTRLPNGTFDVSYTCTLSFQNPSYYGMDVMTQPIAVKNHTGILNYIGWPKLSSWKSSWGQPDWRLSSNQWINSKYGYAQGMLLNDYTYTFSGTKNIDRGNSRVKSEVVTVGCYSSSEDTRFNTALKDIILKTEEIPECKFEGSLSCSVDSPQTNGTRYIRLSAKFQNTENYYTAKLYNAAGQVLASSANGATTLTYNIPITKDMYQTKVSYKIKLWGKDGNCYDTQESGVIYIEPSGVGVTVKDSGNHSVSNMNFRNVNNKEIKEVWVKVNGKIYQTRK